MLPSTFAACALVLTVTAAAQDALPSELVKLPTNTILIKGAEPSASDASTPLPESGRVIKDVYRNAYFGIAWQLPAGWSENFAGPPPSDSGMYVLALAGPS